MPASLRIRLVGTISAGSPMSDQSSGIYPSPAETRTVVREDATLDGFVTAATAGPGVAVRALEPLTALLVETRNTRYHIIVSRGDEIVIQGGVFFPDPAPAHLDGASLGTGLLRLGWIGVGLRMEIRAAGQRIVTTAVRSITRINPQAASGPH